MIGVRIPDAVRWRRDCSACPISTFADAIRSAPPPRVDTVRCPKGDVGILAIGPPAGRPSTMKPSAPRRAVALTCDRVTFAVMAAELGISLSTLRRQIRPVGDATTRALWVERLDLRERARGASLPVYHASKARFAEWRWVLREEDPPVDNPVRTPAETDRR